MGPVDPLLVSDGNHGTFNLIRALDDIPYRLLMHARYDLELKLLELDKLCVFISWRG